MKTMATTVIDRLVIVALGTTDPSDEEWKEYLKLIERQGIERTQHLIVTEGGEPAFGQRRQLNALVAGRKVPVAVVSASPWVRATVAVLSWFNRRIKPFPASRLRDAIAYLEIPSTRIDLITRKLDELRRELRAPR